MIRIGTISIAFRCIAAAMATPLWLGSVSPAKAVDEFPPSRDCKPISYCVTYHKGEAGQLAGRCVRWAQILPCVPTPAPADRKSSVESEVTNKREGGVGRILKQTTPPSPEEKAGVFETPHKGIGDILKETKP